MTPHVKVWTTALLPRLRSSHAIIKLLNDSLYRRLVCVLRAAFHGDRFVITTIADEFWFMPTKNRRTSFV
jgi:hypothetical protein